jgi:N-hydroxyarylamine O-acetyltransferase
VEFVERYLERLAVRAGDRRDLDLLRELQAAHLRTIPFENLSIHLGEELSLDRDALTRKILERHRGGFCYELNGLFALLLVELGYGVELLGARVSDGGTFGPPLDHLVLRVTIPASQSGAAAAVDHSCEVWLVDVGFGMHSLYPLPWEPGVDHRDPGGVFRLDASGQGDWDLFRDGTVQYRIEPNARVLADFAAMCWYQQHSPGSHFTRSLICSRLTADGRVTLSGRRLIVATGDERQEFEIDDDQQLLAAYRTRFGIPLDRLPRVPATPPSRSA